MQAIGIDVGGSGCRLAVVDAVTGGIQGEVVRLDHDLDTPTQEILEALRRALDGFPPLPVGLGFPGRVDGTTVRAAPNLRSTWPGTDVAEALDRPDLVLLNDADAAAVAEQRLGAAAGEDGTVLVITVGTGLGSGVHHAGRLVPGFELGLLPHPTRGGVLETHASGRARTLEALDLPTWSNRFNEALAVMEQAVDASLIVVGGGLTEHWDTFSPLLKASAPLRKATFGAHAGLIGAALAAVDLSA
ncbi:MAG: ROK family protein [Candidatus Thermoplasmatota archaeon]|nr:ROK family protein [Candidatus Thermoplasmatota archaeon]MEC8625680.1 ROK family protein [Candidatus Thermoplasmatota archaeon]